MHEPTTMQSYRQLNRIVDTLEKRLVHTLDVASRHQPGTQHHTKATRLAQALKANIEMVKGVIEKKRMDDNQT